MESDWVYCHFRQKKDSLNNFLAKKDVAEKNYKLAINRLLDAGSICPEKKKEVESWLQKCFGEIQADRNEAIKERENQRKLTKVMQAVLRQERMEDLEAIKNGALPELYILSIGVEEYTDRKVEGARKDTEEVLFSWAEKNPLFLQTHNYLLMNKDANRALITRRIREIVTASRQNDIVLIHFRGQGKDGAFLLPKGEGLFTGDELFELLKDENAFVLLSLDYSDSRASLAPFELSLKSVLEAEKFHKVFGLGVIGPCTSIERNGMTRSLLSYGMERIIKIWDNDLDQNGVLYLDEFFQRLLEELERDNGGYKNFSMVVPPTVSNLPIRQFGQQFHLPIKEKPIASNLEQQIKKE